MTDEKGLFGKFAPRVWAIWTMAQMEAEKQQSFIGTNHFLSAILREGGGVAVHVLQQYNVDLGQMVAEVEARPSTEATENEHATNAKASLTLQAKQMLGLADEEAISLQHPSIGTEHLLLGMLREEQCIAAQVLKNYGVELEKTRSMVASLINQLRAKRAGQ